MEAVIAVIVVLVLGNFILTAVMFKDLCIPSAEERTDRQVDLAVEERPDPMDEGFENIMRFSVNGKTGFERDE